VSSFSHPSNPLARDTSDENECGTKQWLASFLYSLTVFNFVLAAPVAAREVREATADAVDRGEDVKTVSEASSRGKGFEYTAVIGGAASSWPSSPESDRWSEVSQPPGSFESHL
jgi:hypothetical protein